jgi:hypothetical protein
MDDLNELETIMAHIEEIDACSIPCDVIEYGSAARRHLVFMIGLYLLVDALLEAHGRVLIKDIISYFEKYGANRREVMDVLLSYSMENYARLTGGKYEDIKGSLYDGTLTEEDILGFFRKDIRLSSEDEKLL